MRRKPRTGLGATIEEMMRNQQRRQKELPVMWEENKESIWSLKPRGKKAFQEEGTNRAKCSWWSSEDVLRGTKDSEYR